MPLLKKRAAVVQGKISQLIGPLVKMSFDVFEFDRIEFGDKFLYFDNKFFQLFVIVVVHRKCSCPCHMLRHTARRSRR